VSRVKLTIFKTLINFEKEQNFPCWFELADQESRLLKLKVIWSEIWKAFLSENEIETVYASSGAMLVLKLNLES